MAMMNRIIPTKVMIPTKLRIVPNPKEKLGIVGVDPDDVAAMDANMDQMKSIVVITIMTGMIISIKLAVKPSFLPDSRDMLIPKILGCKV
jgi:hypothetical protein